MPSGGVAVVTGGASGIGRAIARRFAAEGAAVVVLDKNPQPFPQGNGVSGIVCDVTSERDVVASMARVIAEHGRIDVLVNNAGISPQSTPLDQFEEQAWNEMLDVHVKGALFCSKHVFAQMKRQQHGVIINIASLGGLRGRPLRHSYIAAKHALVGLTRSTALEGIADNIRVNAIAPGPVDTSSEITALSPEEQRTRLEAHRADGGSEISFVIRPEAVAAAALFLASDEALNITGVILPVDGGIMAGSLERGRLRFPFR